MMYRILTVRAYLEAIQLGAPDAILEAMEKRLYKTKKGEEK